MRRLLVTGGAGFIGSHYVRGVLSGALPDSADLQVTVLDLLTYAGRRENLPAAHPRLRFVHGDVCDQELLDRIVPGHDAVVHFAAESHVDRSLTGPGAFVHTNVVGTQRLLDAAVRHGTERFLYVSTDEVYGSIRTGRWTEDSPLLPNSPYAASKAAGDLLARAYHRTYGLDVRITRCSNNYGTHQHPEKLIPRFVTRILAGQPVPLYGDGRNVREWLHVEDHCRALQLVLTRGRAGEVYNVGGGEALSNRDMTARLLNLLDARWDVVRHVEDRKGHDLRYAIDDTKIREELGYAPRWSLDRGLPQVVAWYREHARMWPAGVL
ncbi:dTDP-glucose 4,6-dehydratase [Streptomyces thermoviolaceus]|uniref:dTDP-glucose 4,6-dehydratase n=1 Tax=Streptomyces thermoviolaceus subsp. thermoviolaceus TaxID=66860 RepID=A0ABX0YZ39_STRTL|nr:dTDP-glucose 4,6-dehydratase [Streptomyces thermoviolaceus]MCM3264798.1 dTDP-glucose 4,6-dehydratase [Streptomyces thermoviolaceus]NJP16366.1 dTDP-glucose 4,6-dehydratase [Streptomyces thermoviolaceus subsp. thermoviolaceus]WTD48910.1 dTDP-glucose 4,6-dehydratase [Streptomyces thermoviolaceus]GHB08644.1 dTDP-glucose 4,6-dehydratase [Streptomyces thermoviolaceus subsp. thermoviolaceus]